MKQEYRICKLTIPRSLLNKGFNFPLDEQLRVRLLSEYGWTDRSIESLAIEAWEKSLEGWELISMAPLEKESSADELIVLVVMRR